MIRKFLSDLSLPGTLSVNLILILINYLINLFLSALGLCCCARAFSSCGDGGATLCCGARASHCSGFSCCRAWAVGRRLSSCGARG